MSRSGIRRALAVVAAGRRLAQESRNVLDGLRRLPFELSRTRQVTNLAGAQLRSRRQMTAQSSWLRVCSALRMRSTALGATMIGVTV